MMDPKTLQTQINQKVDRDVRALIGDLHMQVIVLRSVLEVQQQPKPEDQPPPPNPQPAPPRPAEPPDQPVPGQHSSRPARVNGGPAEPLS